MQHDSTPAAKTRPSLSPRSIQALAATQTWARLAGISLLVLACVELALGIANLFHHPAFPGNMPISPRDMFKFTALNSMLEVAAITIYAVTGWYALRYARRLQRVRQPARPKSEDIAVALGAQQRYWRLQGVATIVFIVLSMLFVIAMAVVGIGLAIKH